MPRPAASSPAHHISPHPPTAPQVEDPRRALVLYGTRTSQTIKDVLTDIHKLKGVRWRPALNIFKNTAALTLSLSKPQVDSVKYSRKNYEVRPFDTGGEVQLEIFANRGNCSLFALGTHTKKRPDNLTLGRMYDFRLYDAIEFGVLNFAPIRSFPGATAAQLGNKPAFVFVGDAFETNPTLSQARSLLLDFFRGRQITQINLKGLDRVVFVTHAPLAAPDAVAGATLLFRQYSVKLKKSGTRVPRTELTEMGPHMDLEVRRARAPPVDLEKEAKTHPKVAPKKQKNVGGDALEGKIGRIYMPKQTVDTMALAKPKGLKRERRETRAAAAADGSKRARREGEGDSE